MIQTKIKVDYSKPNEGKKLAFIVLEATYTMTPNNVLYNVQHYAIVDDVSGAKVAVTSTEKTLTISQYNQFSGAVDVFIQEFDTTEMTAFEIEQVRVKLGLFIYVTQFDFMEDGVHVAYELLPTDFELSA
jgi:hypothetical protein